MKVLQEEAMLSNCSNGVLHGFYSPRITSVELATSCNRDC
jgi:hypothetical protein